MGIFSRKKDGKDERIEELENQVEEVRMQYVDQVDQLKDYIGEQFDYSKDRDPAIGVGGSVDTLKYISPERREDMLTQIMYMYYRNPWARNIIDVTTNFICGAKFTFSADDENEDVQDYILDFWESPDNKLGTRSREMIERTLRDGEIFVRYFFNDDMVVVRMIDSGDISEIFVDKDDYEKVEKYHYHVDTRIDEQNNTVEEIDVMLDPNEIQHIKINVDANVLRGRSIIEPALQGLKYYDDWLLGRIILNRMKSSIFLEKIIKKGSPSDVASLKAAHSTRENITSRTAYKLPRYGTMVVHGDNVEYKWVVPDVNAKDTAEDGRQVRLAIAAAVGMPEFLVTSDASNANYSSTLVTQNPFVRKIKDFQVVFGQEFQEMFRKVIDHGIEKDILPKMSTEYKLKDSIAIKVRGYEKIINENQNYTSDKAANRIKELVEMMEDERSNTGNYEIVPVPTKRTVTIEWPPVIHTDEEALTKSIVMQMNLGLLSRETAASRLGYNYEQETKNIRTEEDGLGKPVSVPKEEPQEPDETDDTEENYAQQLGSELLNDYFEDEE